MLIHTQYHKGQQQSGAYKENIRFLPRPVGHLLLDYLAYVMPLRQLFLRQQQPKALISPYLWATPDSTVWPDSALSSCLTKACARAQVPRLHTSNWRHFSVAICKEKFSKGEQADFDLGRSQVEEQEQELGEDELDLAAMAGQWNHSFPTSNRAYAGATALTTNALLHRGYRASQAWQQLFRFDQVLQQGSKRPRGDSDAAIQATAMASRVRRGRLRQRGTYTEAELLATARQLYNDPLLQFRGSGQREAILAVLGPQPAEQVVLIASTGAGKTLVAMLSAAVASARTTIFILPIVALRGDMLRRCQQVGIQPLVWSAESRSRSRSQEAALLVFVAAESACIEQFLDYAKGLALWQQLDRIIIDECHLTITASDYWPHMSLLGWHLRQVPTQTVWLTATLPPALQEEFIQQNKLVRPRIIRESTNRPNIKYLVNRYTGPSTPIEQAAALVQAYWPQKELFSQPQDKIIVYCPTRTEAGQLGEILQCPVYTSKSGTAEEKAAILARWLENPNQPAIAATSALGLGLDYPYIRCIVHAGAPTRATCFVQESGRAGCSGEPASSIVLLSATWQPQLDQGLSLDEEAMQLYLTQQHCCRGVLSQFLDDEPHWRWCMAGEEACQVC